ncbi:MAG: ParB/RepB/Spo0J family partition protein [Acidobacteria bacterium]|nr:ParB/RepB/Spo0J family partition protein [Acidobacteriota bacterium]
MQNTQKKTTNGNGSGLLQMIPLSSIELLPGNPRQSGDPKKFAELVSSIKQSGVLQPILVREIKPENSGKAKFQLIAGERRVRASEKLGLKEIPAQVKTMTDAEALGARLIENLQREDIHPLDEAEGFLRFKEEMKLDIRSIANRVGKDARYIARRLALTNLIAEAKEDFRKERLTLGHTLELSRLAPEIQAEALAACYESKPVPKKQGEEYIYKPDKTRPAKSVQYLQGWLSQNVHLNLQKAPFKLDDQRLREDGLICHNCPQRSGHDKLLFADIKSSDTCLNPLCFQGKLQKLIQLTQASLAEKQEKPANLISSYYGSRTAEENVLGRDKYQLLQNKADRCELPSKRW